MVLLNQPYQDLLVGYLWRETHPTQQEYTLLGLTQAEISF